MIRPRSQRHLLVQGGTVLTQDAARRILEGDVLITEGEIVAVEPGITPPSPARLLDARGMVLIPGLIQPRALLGRTLLRGASQEEDDLSVDAAHDDETAYWSGLVGALHHLMSGVTTVAGFELSRGMNGLRRALDASGIRAVYGPAADTGTDAFLRTGVDPGAWLEGVTRGNANVLGLDSELGSLEPGNAGDLVVLDVRDLRSFSHPAAPWPERVLWSLNHGTIRWVVVDGEVLVVRGGAPHLDLDRWAGPVEEAARTLLKRVTEKGN